MRKQIDWNKPLQIYTHEWGIVPVHVIGMGLKNKRIVQIEKPNGNWDGTLPNLYVPDECGYCVQFDKWIENVPPLVKEVWISLYKSGGAYVSEHMPKDTKAIAICKITLTEGEFDLDGIGIVDK